MAERNRNTARKNPLIGAAPSETAENIQYVLAYMQNAEASSGSMSELIDRGRIRILECVGGAIESLVETLNRKEPRNG